jgi:hypothetical protein
MRNEKRNIDQKTGGRPKILSKIWETGRKKGCPHRCQYVSTTLLHGDLDTPPQVSQVRIQDEHPDHISEKLKTIFWVKNTYRYIL